MSLSSAGTCLQPSAPPQEHPLPFSRVWLKCHLLSEGFSASCQTQQEATHPSREDELQMGAGLLKYRSPLPSAGCRTGWCRWGAAQGPRLGGKVGGRLSWSSSAQRRHLFSICTKGRGANRDWSAPRDAPGQQPGAPHSFTPWHSPTS